MNIAKRPLEISTHGKGLFGITEIVHMAYV